MHTHKSTYKYTHKHILYKNSNNRTHKSTHEHMHPQGLSLVSRFEISKGTSLGLQFCSCSLGYGPSLLLLFHQVSLKEILLFMNLTLNSIFEGNWYLFYVLFLLFSMGYDVQEVSFRQQEKTFAVTNFRTIFKITLVNNNIKISRNQKKILKCIIRLTKIHNNRHFDGNIFKE